MNSKEFLNQTIKDRKKAAKAAGVSLPLVNKWCNQYYEGPDPLGRLVSILDYAIKDNPEHAYEILQFLAKKYGFFLVPVPEVSEDIEDKAQKILNQTMVKYGKIFEMHDKIFSNDKITQKELKQASGAIWMFINHMLAYYKDLEANVVDD